MADPANVVSSPPTEIIRDEVGFVVISCTISGLPPPNIQWTANNTGTITNRLGKYDIMTTPPSVNTDSVTDTDTNTGPYLVTSRLVIRNLTISDQQRYTCNGVQSFHISNFIGAISSASTILFVRGKEEREGEVVTSLFIL